MKYSQFEEETHIFSILNEIGDGTKVCADIGARLTYSNVARLIQDRGFQGYLVDADPQACAELMEKLPQANVICTKATIENINSLVPENTHVLSIDVDSHDWWLWANLKWKPALVIIETTPCHGMRVAEYGAGRKDPKGYGCSVDAAKALGGLKGYRYLGRTQANAFFTNQPCDYRLPQMNEHAGRPTTRENSVL